MMTIRKRVRSTVNILIVFMTCVNMFVMRSAYAQPVLNPGQGGREWNDAAGVPDENGEKEPLCITRKLGKEKPENIPEPDPIYWDREGKQYELDHWVVETIPAHTAGSHLEKQIVYTEVEGAQGLPESIPVEEEMSGEPAEGELKIRDSRIVREEWQDGFNAPVIFHSYGADEYRSGSIVVQGEDILLSTVMAGGELLEMMGLSPQEYRILNVEWDGGAYTDEDGVICRRAVASGQKLTRDYEVTYEGEVTWMEPEAYEVQMFYRAMETAAVPSPNQELQPVQEQEIVPAVTQGALWYWVRSGFVITVGAGLIGICVGTLILFILWLRQNRRERQRKYLPFLKG